MPPVKTLGKISKYVDGLPIPRLSFEEVFNSLEEGDERPKLQVAKLVELNDEDLQTILYHYGAGKAFLESELSDIESKTALVEDLYNDLFSITSYKIVDRREKGNLKKLTREELKGAVLLESEDIKKYKQQLREGKARYVLIEGELKSYSSLYSAVSRVITLRTYDKKEYNK